MASPNQIKEYIALWLQLGKKIIINNGQEIYSLQKIIEGGGYSQEFEQYWQKILDPNTGDSYLEETQETIQELLTPAWEMMICARCPMPVPIRVQGLSAGICPCHSLSHWPNTELPIPRGPVNSQNQLRRINNRLTIESCQLSNKDGSFNDL